MALGLYLFVYTASVLLVARNLEIPRLLSATLQVNIYHQGIDEMVRNSASPLSTSQERLSR